jgi:hypothetical protein
VGVANVERRTDVAGALSSMPKLQRRIPGAALEDVRERLLQVAEQLLKHNSGHILKPLGIFVSLQPP